MYPQIFGKYVLERELASGGMARVFCATLRGAGGFEKRLAVKQIRPELANDERFVERFIQEAKTAVELSHPNIVPVYELGVEGGVYYIAMELCPGVTLADLLAARGALGLEAGAYVGVEVGRALDYAHRRSGIVHRDVTPRNVLIDDEGAVRLIDFGIARPVTGGSVEVFGSPGHMPPEQVRGETLTPATDVFALGALVIEACTGQAPFRRSTEQESLAAVESLPVAPSELDPRMAVLDRALLAAVDPDPRRRSQTVDELGRVLRESLREVDLGDLARELGRRTRYVSRSVPPDLAAHEAPSPRSGERSPPAIPSRTFATRSLSSPREEPAVTRPLEPPANLSPTTRPLSSVHEEPQITRPLLVPEDVSTRPLEGAMPRRHKAWLPVALFIAVALLLWGVRWWSLPEETAAFEVNAAVASQVPDAPAKDRHADAHPAEPDHRPSTESPEFPPGSASEEREPSKDSAGSSSGKGNVVASGRGTDSLASQRASNAATLGTVMLTAAPPAQVTIAGRRLTTPVEALRLPAGEYRATFVSPAWDGAISAPVRLEEGAVQHLHADFTSEPPRVVVR